MEIHLQAKHHCADCLAESAIRAKIVSVDQSYDESPIDFVIDSRESPTGKEYLVKWYMSKIPSFFIYDL